MNKTESQVLGSILYKPETFYDCLRHKVTAESFVEGKHIKLWGAMDALYAKGKNIDAISLCIQIAGKDHDDEWSMFMQDLVDEIYSTHDVDDHIKRLKERERRRKALLVMEDAPNDTSDEMVGNVVGELSRMRTPL